MPYTLITVVTPSEPTGRSRAGGVRSATPRSIQRARDIGSHLPRLSEPRVALLLVLISVFSMRLEGIIWSRRDGVKSSSAADAHERMAAPPSRHLKQQTLPMIRNLRLAV